MLTAVLQSNVFNGEWLVGNLLANLRTPARSSSAATFPRRCLDLPSTLPHNPSTVRDKKWRFATAGRFFGEKLNTTLLAGMSTAKSHGRPESVVSGKSTETAEGKARAARSPRDRREIFWRKKNNLTRRDEYGASLITVRSTRWMQCEARSPVNQGSGEGM